MKRLIPNLVAGFIAAMALTSSGCLGTVGVGVNADVQYAEPQLAYVGPGVWVVQDYNEPVFYENNFYWVNRGGVWYRSSYHTGGWVAVNVVPYRIRTIRNRRRYVRYRARPGTRVRRGPVRVRDHRRGRNYRRDRRQYRRDRRDARRDRRDARRDRRQYRRDRRNDRRDARRDRRDARRDRVRVRDHRRDNRKKKKDKKKIRVRDHRD